METELQNSLCRLQEADATVQGAKTTIMQQEQIDATLASSLRPASPAQAHPRPPPPVLPSAKVATTAQGCDWTVLVFSPNWNATSDAETQQLLLLHADGAEWRGVNAAAAARGAGWWPLPVESRV